MAGSPPPEEAPSPADVEDAAKRLRIDPSQYAAHLSLLDDAAAGAEIARVLGPSDAAQPDRSLVYGTAESNNLVFIPEQRARDLAEVVDAWWHSATWGEFRRRVEARGLTDTMLAPWEAEGCPPDDELLTKEQKEWYTGDWDWPSWPAAEMLEWMPSDVLDLGEPGVSMTSGPAVWFEPEQAPVLVAALEERGFACRRDDDLVRGAGAPS